MFKIHKEEIEIEGKKIVLETGKIARQADGAIIATCGETVGKGQGLNSVFEILSNLGIEISSMRNETGRLEELFLGLVDSTLNEKKG